MRRFVIGDIHGRAVALQDVLEKCKFKNEDLLIILGDVVDGGSDTKEAVDILVSIPNKIFIWGNHDKWFMSWINAGVELPLWVHQGGKATMASYDFKWREIPKTHRIFFESGRYYYVDDYNNVFVHGGFDPWVPLLHQASNPHDQEYLMWSRDLIGLALREGGIPNFNMVFIGHTSTELVQKERYTPIHIGNLIMMDTGAGWMGRLTIMNVDTLDYWQSKKQDRPRKFDV